MADGNDNFMGLDRDQLRDIGLGIGAGFQSYDPNNPFAGAGAALSATLGSGIIREERKRERQNKIEDEARQEERILRMARQQREDQYNFYRDKRMQMIASGKKGAVGPRDGSAAMLQATEYGSAAMLQATKYGKALWNELSRFFKPVGKRPAPYRAPMSTETAEQLDIVDPYWRDIGDGFMPQPEEPNAINDLIREMAVEAKRMKRQTFMDRYFGKFKNFYKGGTARKEDLTAYLDRFFKTYQSDQEDVMDAADPYRNEPVAGVESGFDTTPSIDPQVPEPDQIDIAFENWREELVPPKPRFVSKKEWDDRIDEAWENWRDSGVEGSITERRQALKDAINRATSDLTNGRGPR